MSTVEEVRLLALRGQELPTADRVKLGYAKQAIIHGIRHHLAFAQSLEVVAVCQQPSYPAFTRARHARLIMSNIVPDMGDDDAVFPYCIWHPEVAAEDTYREVARRYPGLKYHVSRACAVAGYLTLYKELHVLPEVAVAEEAQASERGGEIFQHIMAQPMRYAVMNDYENKLYEPPRPGACLNADTAIASVLQFRRMDPDDRLQAWPSYWDIEEDGYIGEEEEVGHGSERHFGTVTAREIELLENPLPVDLPVVNKDVLILMAAYEGNLDRYARLQRPSVLRGEEGCIARGIYHNTSFAKWCATQNLNPAASNARRTMVNDLSWLTPSIAEEDLPYMIWYPLRPDFKTLFEIVRREPRMWVAVAHACIACNYARLFDLLLSRITPTRELFWESGYASNPHFKEMLAPLQEQGKLKEGKGGAVAEEDKEPTETLVSGWLFVDSIWEKHHRKLYAGHRANAASLELYMMVPEKIRTEAAASETLNYALYEFDDGIDRKWDESIFHKQLKIED
ncbi:hypothetical protein CCM_07746 [Cordyceps militaris CM01]|uniref:Uncharacterized protein n=1 Tax=Cordyceps militaris (strain CM01) TaxID=983644 RepID=G3JQJ0_CORMM|nr:uncharacterized protein CCM_07746 [Cordyceps militaris CM01]EGX89494.1 hypothetical protein CCM_07746 [Cordyceps militaris CM01]